MEMMSENNMVNFQPESVATFTGIYNTQIYNHFVLKESPEDYKEIKLNKVDEIVCDKKFPYVVVRIMDSVFNEIPVIFHKGEPDLSILSGKAMHVFNSSYVKGEPLTKEVKKQVLDAAEKFRERVTNFRFCVVFSKKECVYYQLDGSKKNSKCPPSGGLVMSNN
jgi:hypothetical protein